MKSQRILPMPSSSAKHSMVNQLSFINCVFVLLHIKHTLVYPLNLIWKPFLTAKSTRKPYLPNLRADCNFICAEWHIIHILFYNWLVDVLFTLDTQHDPSQNDIKFSLGYLDIINVVWSCNKQTRKHLGP